jgi:uncharacterized protein (DUF2235 family)
MPRNLIVCCDGTNNQFGTENTSVVRLVQVLDQDPVKQQLFYDGGVGTLPEIGMVTRLGKWLSKVLGLAFGRGLVTNIGHAYLFLMNNWQPGDEIYLFGFSRGAYTVRALAALLHMFGLLPKGSDNLLPYVLRLFSASRAELHQDESAPISDRATAYWNLCNSFRETFARAVPGVSNRHFPVHFMGLWDTVASVGWVWDPVKFPYTRKNPGVSIVRHAISIDERRCFFRQNQLVAAPAQDSQERWFAGVHCDIGGGYPESMGGLWREAYAWMLQEAVAAGLVVGALAANQVWTRVTPPAKPYLEPKQESLRGAWWVAEFLPKRVYSSTLNRKILAVGLGRRRRIPSGAQLHASAVARIREQAPIYEPRNLPPEFLEMLRTNPDAAPVVP